MAKKRFKLRDLKIKRVSLARSGVNQHAHILLAKALPEDAELLDEIADYLRGVDLAPGTYELAPGIVLEVSDPLTPEPVTPVTPPPVTKAQPKATTMTNPRDVLFQAALAAAKDGDRDASNKLYNAYRATASKDIAKSAPEPTADDVLLKDEIHRVVVAKAAMDALLPKNWSKNETTLMFEAYSSSPEGRQLYDLQRSSYGTQPLSKVRATVAKSAGALSGLQQSLNTFYSWKRNVD